MCRNPTLRGNLIAMCCMWAISGFCYYMIDFYAKYLPGSVFVTKAFFGCCDAVSVIYASMLEKTVNSVPLVLRLTLFLTVFFSIMFMAFSQYSVMLVPLLSGMTRMQINALLCYSYHVNQYLFPTLFRGAAYSMTNFVSRPVIGIGTFISEYTTNPMLIVSVMASINIGATFMIRPPGEEEDEVEISKISQSMIKVAGREPPFNVSIKPEGIVRKWSLDVARSTLTPVVHTNTMLKDTAKKLGKKHFGTPAAYHGASSNTCQSMQGHTRTYKADTYYQL